MIQGTKTASIVVALFCSACVAPEPQSAADRPSDPESAGPAAAAAPEPSPVPTHPILERPDPRAAIKDHRSRELAAPGAASATTAFVGAWRVEATGSGAPDSPAGENSAGDSPTGEGGSEGDAACALAGQAAGRLAGASSCPGPLGAAVAWRASANPRGALRLELLDPAGAVVFIGFGPLAGEWRGADADGRRWRLIAG